MANGIVQLPPDSSGKKVDTSELTVGANTVERQRMVIADDATDVCLAAVKNSAPSSEYGLVTRNIPSGTQQAKIHDGTNAAVLTNATPGASDYALVTRPIPSGLQNVQVHNGTNAASILNAAPTTEYGLVVRPIPSGTQTVVQAPSGTAGWTPHTLISGASTNATNVKASAGCVGVIYAANTVGSVRYLKVFDKASSPTVGTDTPKLNIMIPPNSSGVVFTMSPGFYFSLGIGYAITGGQALLDTTSVAAGDVVLNLGWN